MTPDKSKVKESKALGGFIGLVPIPQFTAEQIKKALDTRAARLKKAKAKAGGC